MQLSASQLGNHLQRGLKSLYTLFGDEPLLIQEAADAIRAAARAHLPGCACPPAGRPHLPAARPAGRPAIDRPPGRVSAATSRG